MWAARSLGNFDNGQPSSFLQLTAADQGDEFRVVASIADETGQTDTATSAPTTAVTDVTARDHAGLYLCRRRSLTRQERDRNL